MVVVSLLAAGEAPRQEAVHLLRRSLGPLAHLSAPLAFDHSQYYAPEMGAPLTRRLAGFVDLVSPWDLAAIKQTCLAIEHELARDGRRRVNIDPGLLGPGSLVLASTKASPHRVAIAPGLWAELTLLFQHGDFTPLPWTYQDYAGLELRGLLRLLRGRLRWQLGQTEPQGGNTC
jgi:hypothetical protein